MISAYNSVVASRILKGYYAGKRRAERALMEKFPTVRETFRGVLEELRSEDLFLVILGGEGPASASDVALGEIPILAAQNGIFAHHFPLIDLH